MRWEQFAAPSPFNKGTRWLAETLDYFISSKQSRRLAVNKQCWRKPSRWSCRMEPLQVLIGEGKMGQASEKTLSPLPGAHRALQQPFPASVKPSPVEAHSASASVLSFPTRAAVHRTVIAAAPLGGINHSNIWPCSSTSAGMTAASPPTRGTQQKRRCALAVRGYLWLWREPFHSPGFWAISPNSIRLWH